MSRCYQSRDPRLVQAHSRSPLRLAATASPPPIDSTGVIGLRAAALGSQKKVTKEGRPRRVAEALLREWFLRDGRHGRPHKWTSGRACGSSGLDSLLICLNLRPNSARACDLVPLIMKRTRNLSSPRHSPPPINLSLSLTHRAYGPTQHNAISFGRVYK